MAVLGDIEALPPRLWEVDREDSVQSFAYPFGSVSPAALPVVKREFHVACTTVLKRTASEPLHWLLRIDMYYVRSLHDLKRLLNGQLDRYLAVRRWGRSVCHVLMSRRAQTRQSYRAFIWGEFGRGTSKFLR